MDEKTCSRCHETKPIAKFRLRQSGVPYGQCRPCEQIGRLGSRGPVDRSRWAPVSKEVRRKWNRTHSDQRKVHKAVEMAVLRGDLARRPCERCGDAVGVHAHHESYDLPLDVMWLCPKHHKQRHRELRAQQQRAA